MPSETGTTVGDGDDAAMGVVGRLVGCVVVGTGTGAWVNELGTPVGAITSVGTTAGLGANETGDTSGDGGDSLLLQPQIKTRANS